MHIFIFLFVTMLNLLLSGCTAVQEEPKLRDLDFTVVEQGMEPDNLRDLIDEKKAEPFQLSYVIGEDMYIVVGYGEQEVGGYSIQVKELYETESSIYLDTVLTGPENVETLNKQESYPYITLKLETIENKFVDFH